MVIKYEPRIKPTLDPKKVPKEWTSIVVLAVKLGFYLTEIKQVLIDCPEVEYDDWTEMARRKPHA